MAGVTTARGTVLKGHMQHLGRLRATALSLNKETIVEATTMVYSRKQNETKQTD